MDKRVFIFICAALVIFSLAIWGWGCSKKPESQEVSEYPLNTSTASQPTDVIVINPTPAPGASKAQTSSLQPLPTELSAPQTSIPPALSEEEKRLTRNKDIQKALKNAGFYTGEIDSKIGPMTRKAIREFQVSKSLTADGKVGPKTWAELEKYLNWSADTKKSKKKK